MASENTNPHIEISLKIGFLTKSRWETPYPAWKTLTICETTVCLSKAVPVFVATHSINVPYRTCNGMTSAYKYQSTTNFPYQSLNAALSQVHLLLTHAGKPRRTLAWLGTFGSIFIAKYREIVRVYATNLFIT